MTISDDKSRIEAIETDLLLEGIYRAYGYDFRNYESASLRRRILAFAVGEGATSISDLQEKILYDSLCLDRFIVSLTINVTDMFRDPEFYRALRDTVVPILNENPLIRVWHAGCSTGEEAYSTAITFMEEGIYDKCRIYATDMNQSVVQKARKGIFPLAYMKEYTENYIKAGGTDSFSRYYTANFDHVILHHSLRKNIVFAHHNLVTDRSFNKFDLILVRNVLIYFNDELRNRVLDLLDSSLSETGILALGNRETLLNSNYGGKFQEIAEGTRLYRRCA